MFWHFAQYMYDILLVPCPKKIQNLQTKLIMAPPAGTCTPLTYLPPNHSSGNTGKICLHMALGCLYKMARQQNLYCIQT